MPLVDLQNSGKTYALTSLWKLSGRSGSPGPKPDRAATLDRILLSRRPPPDRGPGRGAGRGGVGEEGISGCEGGAAARRRRRARCCAGSLVEPAGGLP